MTPEEFRNILKAAIAGDNTAMEKVVELYMPLIDKYSHIKGVLDEDLRQHLLTHIITHISDFAI